MKIEKIIAGITAAALTLSLGTISVSANILTQSDISSLQALDNTSRGYGQGRECDENNCPTGAKLFNGEYGKYDSFAYSEQQKGITLTFDQGYENGFTEKILDTLKDKNVKAVFFLTGDYAKRNKELVERMINEGHIIGNHGMKHKSLPSLSPAEAEEEIMSLHNYVAQEYKYNMSLLRPPCGEYSERALAVCQKLGYKTVLWSYAYCDWDVNKQPEPASSLEKASGAAHNGAIYLLHSVSATNAEILPRLIDNIRQQGFEFTLPV